MNQTYQLKKENGTAIASYFYIIISATIIIIGIHDHSFEEIISGVLLFLCFVSIRYMKQRRQTKYIITDDGISFENHKIEYTVLYEDIIYIESSKDKFTGSSIIISSRHQDPIIISKEVIGSWELIKALKMKLEAIGRDDKYNEVKLNQFYKVSYYDEQFKMNHKHFLFLHHMTLLSGLITLMIFILLRDNLTALLILGSVAISYVVYAIVNRFAFRTVIKNQVLNDIIWHDLSFDKDSLNIRYTLVNVFEIILFLGTLVISIFLI